MPPVTMPLLLILTLALGESPESPKADPSARLRQALADYDAALSVKARSGPESQRLYRSALDGFTSLLHDGFNSAGLHYNIANTQVRLGRIGEAVVQYRRALRLDPGNERVRKNLEAARNLCTTPIAKPASSAFVETILFWHFGTPHSSRTRIGLTAYVLFWGIILVRVVVGRRSAALRWTAMALAGLALVCGASVGWDKVSTANRVEGVITADRVTLRKGNGEYYDPVFDRPLSAGVEFRMLESRQDVQGAPWLRIELPDGKEGWLRADEADMI